MFVERANILHINLLLSQYEDRKMISFKFRTFTIISTLLLCPFIFTGCGSQKATWVNTDSMPGNTFSQYRVDLSDKQKIVNAVQNSAKSSKNNFGPSFDFKDLKR